MTEDAPAVSFGLIVIGNEILDGRVTDRHFANALRLLRERDLGLAYCLMLPDDPQVIEAHLRWALSRPEPFFCCGGIGATPDDHTRACAARVTGHPLTRHSEGEAILRRRLGDRLNEARLRMVDFPQGAALIPNPVNQVPGFTVGRAHFLPGFPEMAEPMTAWVLDTLYTRGPRRVTRTLVLPAGREGDLADLMEWFVAAHPNLRFSSLPRFTADGTELRCGVSGSPEQVGAGIQDLAQALDGLGAAYHEEES